MNDKIIATATLIATVTNTKGAEGYSTRNLHWAEDTVLQFGALMLQGAAHAWTEEDQSHVAEMRDCVEHSNAEGVLKVMVKSLEYTASRDGAEHLAEIKEQGFSIANAVIGHARVARILAAYAGEHVIALAETVTQKLYDAVK